MARRSRQYLLRNSSRITSGMLFSMVTRKKHETQTQNAHSIKAAIQLYAFGYSCIGTICFALWQGTIAMGHLSFPQNWIWVEVAFALHALAAMATFQGGVAWRPLLAVTPGRILAAKGFLSIATLNFLICLCGTIYAVHVGIKDSDGLGAGLILASLLLQNCIYMTLHWAFRPENLVSAAFIRCITNPIGLIFAGTNSD